MSPMIASLAAAIVAASAPFISFAADPTLVVTFKGVPLEATEDSFTRALSGYKCGPARAGYEVVFPTSRVCRNLEESYLGTPSHVIVVFVQNQLVSVTIDVSPGERSLDNSHYDNLRTLYSKEIRVAGVETGPGPDSGDRFSGIDSHMRSQWRVGKYAVEISLTRSTASPDLNRLRVTLEVADAAERAKEAAKRDY